ncbi:O-antigen ligase family protein [Candidatus Uabimicrobium sp. HlEnr_7]|uniref:O-antigen ligase family protein n=1 Tax=Candidatus Uabimicrobium helgolandensis TaxID=3095367 RepID=UPI0035575DDD
MKNTHLYLWGIIIIVCFPMFTNQFIPKTVAAFSIAVICCIVMFCNNSKKFSISYSHIIMIFIIIIMAIPFSSENFLCWGFIAIAFIIFSHSDNMNSVFHSICLAATLASIYGLYQFIFSYLRINTFPTYTSFFSHINSAGAFISCSAVLTLALLFSQKSFAQQLLFTTSFILQISYLICTGNRAGYVAFTCSFLILLTIFAIQIPQQRKKLFLSAIAIVVIFSSFIVIYSPAQKRIASIFDLENNSNKVRLHIWKSTLEISSNHIWTGIGSGNFINYFPQYRNPQEYEISQGRVVSQPHNSFLLILVENGLVALLLFLLLLIYSLKNLYLNKQNNLPSFVLIVSLMINAFFFCIFLAPATGLLLAISLAAASKNGTIANVKSKYIFALLLPFILYGVYIASLRAIANAHFNSGQKNMKESDYKGAISHFQKAQDFWPDKQCNLEMGRCYLAQKKIEKAEYHLLLATKASYLENAFISLGISYIHKNKRNKAVILWKKALNLYPRSLNLNYNAAKLFLELGMGKKALQHFYTVEELSPQLRKNVNFLMNLGLANDQIKQYGKAMEFYEKAKDLDKRKVIPTIYIANTLVKMRFFPSALHHFEFVAKHGNINEIITANISMAKIYEELQQPKLAITLYFKVTGMKRENYEANFLLGRLLFFQKNYTMALKYLQSATKLRTKNPWSVIFTSLVYFEQNNDLFAQGYLQKAKNLGFTSWKELYEEHGISPVTKQKIKEFLQKN